VEDHEPDDLKYYTALDEALFKDGLPHLLDILSVTQLVNTLLEADLPEDQINAFVQETKNILDLAELIRSAKLYVGCDSGPLHLSSAVGTPSVALFGPKDPRTYGPYNPHHRVVLKGELGQGSMEAISVDDAYAAVRDLLAEVGASHSRSA
jgi:ADP-heptose:LPS heptosyltransferase